MQNKVQSLITAGGIDKQVFDRMYEAFMKTHVLKFNQEIQVWKSVAEISSDPAKQSSHTIILWKARKLYQEYGKHIKPA